MVFKCKICGGTLDVKQGERTVVCEYCGVRQSIPSFIEPKTQEIYDRANNYLMHNEFDKAENLYAQILFDNKTDADAYWNILMCHYGVTYVKDPKTGQYIPTCNRTLFRPIFNDPNYENAIKYANDSQRQLYIHNAQIIDNVQKGILSVSKREKPFDIFISYKETDINGTRTKDSIAAQDLYEKLTAEGYKVFFSRITLEDKIGTEYEPYIYAALASSNVMITVCSSKENIESVWVKNEWSRFLGFAAKDSAKTLIPLYFDMDKAELPEDFAYLPAYNMKLPGFEQEFIRGIKKLIPLPVMLLEKRKKRNKILKRIGLAAAVCAAAGVICTVPWFMKLPDYNTAMQLYYDRNYPEATWAFDELDGYRDSEEMKEECELSWRKSLANITNTYCDNSASYYVTANGTIDTFDDARGGLSDQYGINEHGMIVSVEMQGSVVALYEDGYTVYMDNASNYVELDNIVKISPNFSVGSIALKNDGTMTVIEDETITADYEGWLEDINSWKNIVSFDYYMEKQSVTGVTYQAAVVGIKADRTLEISMHDGLSIAANGYAEDTTGLSLETLEKFKNIKAVDFYVQNGMLDIAALTYDNKILTSIQGVYQEYEAPDVEDIKFISCYDQSGNNNYRLYELHSDGKLYKQGDTNYMISDVVHIENGILVTRSGSIYRFDGEQLEPTEGKTKVLNEWLERMD